MRTFNPEKELKKIQKGNKNKIILGVCLLLLIVAIGSSYALYQIKYNKRIIYTTVEPFYRKDIQISLYVDGEKDTTSETFPGKESGKIFSHITCENGSSGVFDNTKWELELKITKQDKCNVYFITGNLPNAPELYQGMIPVVYDNDGNVYVADTNSDWYNYQDHRWGNAVLVDNTKEGVTAKYFDSNNKLREDISGEQIPMDEILQMYVWIPRYKYQLFNVNNEGVPKQIINIKFEKGIENTGNIKCTYTNNGDGTITEDCKDKDTKAIVKNTDWYTHPAFTFKGTTEDSGTELKGFWVGKFEPSDPMDENGRLLDKINEITILPNKTSMVFKTVSTMFYATRDIELKQANKYNLNAEQIDTHMMKNMEWGAVAYLSQSVYGIYKDEKTCNIDEMDFDKCEIWTNNTVQGGGPWDVKYAWGGSATGCVGDSVSAEAIWNEDDNSPAKCRVGNRWNEKGVNASTTGNIYGIYDMSGGSHEYVMGAIVNQKDGGLYLARSEFTTTDGEKKLPDSKYYDIYTFSAEETTHERGHLGDATKEILRVLGRTDGGWNFDYSLFPRIDTSSNDPTAPWFLRGGVSTDKAYAGVFLFSTYTGQSWNIETFRSVLSAA